MNAVPTKPRVVDKDIYRDIQRIDGCNQIVCAIRTAEVLSNDMDSYAMRRFQLRFDRIQSFFARCDQDQVAILGRVVARELGADTG